MSWMAERDRLLAQTKAFVKEVAAAHPRTTPSVSHQPLIPGPPRSDAGIANISALPGSPPSSVPTDPSPIITQPKAEPPQASTPFPAFERVIATPIRKASGEADHGVVGLRSGATPAPDVVLTIPRVATSERDDIAIRVSQFREHQKRLGREREQFSEQMRARIKSVIGNGG